MNKKYLGIFAVLLMMALVAIPNSTSADNFDETFTINQKGKDTAKIKLSSNKAFIKAIVERQGKLAHTYTKSLETNDVTVSVGDKEVLFYNNKTGDYKTAGLDIEKKNIGNVKQLNWTENKYSEMSAATRNLLAEDIKFLRAVRNFDELAQVRSFELSYVILTGDESIYWLKDFSEYKITKLSVEIKDKKTR